MTRSRPLLLRTASPRLDVGSAVLPALCIGKIEAFRDRSSRKICALRTIDMGRHSPFLDAASAALSLRLLPNSANWFPLMRKCPIRDMSRAKREEPSKCGGYSTRQEKPIHQPALY